MNFENWQIKFEICWLSGQSLLKLSYGAFDKFNTSVSATKFDRSFITQRHVFAIEPGLRAFNAAKVFRYKTKHSRNQ
jgi:hypothetical protein